MSFVKKSPDRAEVRRVALIMAANFGFDAWWKPTRTTQLALVVSKITGSAFDQARAVLEDEEFRQEAIYLADEAGKELAVLDRRLAKRKERAATRRAGGVDIASLLDLL